MSTLSGGGDGPNATPATDSGGSPLDGSAQKIVLEKMKMVEDLLDEIGEIRLKAAPIVEDIKQQIRLRLGKVLMGSAAGSQSGGEGQPPTPPNGMATLAGGIGSPAAPPQP